jgi:DNA invertase Pin-like site-specific DNA recombinase
MRAQITVVEGYYQSITPDYPDLEWGTAGNDILCRPTSAGNGRKRCSVCRRKYPKGKVFDRNCTARSNRRKPPDRPGWFVDEVVSANKQSFGSRAGGQRLLSIVQPGDHIIFAKLDRAFRNVVDARTMLDVLQERGIHVHLADTRIKVDLGSAYGKMFITVLALHAEMEADMARERSLEVRAAKIAAGDPCQNPPIGRTIVTASTGKKMIVDDWPVRKVMRAIVYMHDTLEMSFSEIGNKIEEMDARKAGRPYLKEGFGRQWPRSRVVRGYHAEKENIAMGDDPRPLVETLDRLEEYLTDDDLPDNANP